MTFNSDTTKSITSKKKKPVANAWFYLMAFGIPFLIAVLICIGNGVFPFGENCILHMDMYHQYCAFFTEFREKMVNGGSWMYSWNLGLGSDFVSLYAYYLSSPWNLFLAVCPKDYVIEFMTLQILIKIGLCGLTFFFYIKEVYGLKGKDGYFHNNTVWAALVCATAYALSGFVAAYSWDIMWMDCIYLFPVILAGLRRLVREGKPALYYVSLALSIFSNYYISIMICIFLVFAFFYFWMEKGSGKWYRTKALGRFSLYSLLAGGTAAVLILPEIALLTDSGSAGSGFPKEMEWYFHVLGGLGRSATTASTYESAEHWPNLYAGAFSLVLVWLYVCNRRISIKDKLLRLSMLVFLLISFANNYLDYIWHGLHFPQSLPARQSFIFIFLLLTMGFATVRKWKGNRIGHIIFATLLAFVWLLLGYVYGDETVTETYAILICALFVMVYGLLALLSKLVDKQVRKKFAVAAVCIAILELTVNMAVTGFGTTNRTSYVEKREDYEVLLQMAEKDNAGEGFYRVEDVGRKTKNDDAFYGYPSATIFSSLMPLEVSHLFQSLYMEGGLNFYSHNGATPITNAMCSVKYMLSDSPMEENALYTKIGETKDNFLYRCNYYLPLGFMVDEAVIENWKPSRSKRLESLNGWVRELGTNGNYLSYTTAKTKVEPGRTVITIPKEGYYYATYAKCNKDRLTVSRTDGWSQTYAKTTHRYLISLGDCEENEEVYISNNGEEEISFSIYRLNMKTVNDAFATLQEQTMDLVEMDDCRIKGRIDVKKEGRLLLSVPYDKGWKLTVDGEVQEIVPWENAWIGVHLPKGEHEIELNYTTPGLFMGFAISACCIGIFLLLYCMGLFKRHKQSKNVTIPACK